jgi:hypothetical protein
MTWLSTTNHFEKYASNFLRRCFQARTLWDRNAQMRRNLRSNYVGRSSREVEADFSIEKYGERTAEKEECDEQLLAEYAALLGFYVASVAALTGAAVEQDRLPRKFGPLDLALLGIATHKLSRIVAKDRITSILRAPFVSYIHSAGAGEVEQEPRGRGMQRGIGQLISCPYCMAPWCAMALAFGLIFAPRVTRFLPEFWPAWRCRTSFSALTKARRLFSFNKADVTTAFDARNFNLG